MFVGLQFPLPLLKPPSVPTLTMFGAQASSSTVGTPSSTPVVATPAFSAPSTRPSATEFDFFLFSQQQQTPRFQQPRSDAFGFQNPYATPQFTPFAQSTPPSFPNSQLTTQMAPVAPLPFTLAHRDIHLNFSLFRIVLLSKCNTGSQPPKGLPDGDPPPRPPPSPPKPPGMMSGPPPPRPPKRGLPSPRPPQPMAKGSNLTQPPLGPNRSSNTASSDGVGLEGEADSPKAKLKPLFWDKIPVDPDRSMVWHQIKSGSFMVDEEMIETQFGNASPDDKIRIEHRKGSSSQEPSTQYSQIIDLKKSQNISILLQALSVITKHVCNALQEGNELPSELLQTLLHMAPTPEELKLKQFSGELSQLGPAKRFLKALVDIPFDFKRLESLLFMSSLQEEVSITKESFATLELACKELRNSRLFLKLPKAVLKTGNRMNDGTFRGDAQTFKLGTVLKLADVKGTNGKTTLLHFVVKGIIHSERV